MGLLFSRKCVEDLDITPRLKKGRVYVDEQQHPTVMATMMNGHAVVPVFPVKKDEEEQVEWATSVEEALKTPMKKKKGEWLVYEAFAGKGNVTKILKSQGVTVRTFGLDYGQDFLDPKTRTDLIKLFELEEPDAIFMSPPCTAWSTIQNLHRHKPQRWKKVLKKREIQRPIIKFVAELFHRQKKKQRVAMIEHPVTSKILADMVVC